MVGNKITLNYEHNIFLYIFSQLLLTDALHAYPTGEYNIHLSTCLNIVHPTC